MQTLAKKEENALWERNVYEFSGLHAVGRWKLQYSFTYSSGWRVAVTESFILS